jgi:leucyl-tRNA synthetase
MAYYTIAHILNEKKIGPEQLPDEVFDFILLGKGTLRDAVKASGVPSAIIKKMRSEFDYWYPVDMRNSAKELIQNHLTFYIFHHTAIFDEKKWPRTISVNGYVNVEGEKMSKSKGNFLPLKNLINIYGADLVRINIAASAEGMDDADWRAENIPSCKSRLEYVAELVSGLKTAERKKTAEIDVWLIGELQKVVADTTAAFDGMRFRSGVQRCLFDATNALKWYMKRVGGIKGAHKKTLQAVVSAVVRMLCPITPHVSEELWAKLGKGFAVSAKWPAADAKLINKNVEGSEELIKKTLADVDTIVKLVAKKGVTAKKATLFVARTKMFPVPKQKALQLQTLLSARDFLASELRCLVEIVDSDSSQHEKSGKAKPDRLGILIE